MARWEIGNSWIRVALTGWACAALASQALAVDIVGSTDAAIAWTPAIGAVSGYYVIVSRDGGASQVEGVTLDNQDTVSGAYGETLVVRVAAFGEDGEAGPVSDPSDPITFVEATGSTEPGPDPGSDPDPDPGPDPDPDPGTPPGPDPGLGAPAARDFDGDGVSDLIVRNGDDLVLWVMDGAHVASELGLPNAPSGAALVGTGDYDGNRNADLLFEHPETGELVLWLLNGGVVVGMKSIALDLPLDEDWHVGGSADFDADGADDVILWSRVSGTAEIWSFDGSSLVPTAAIDGRRGAWSVTAVGDTDGDGMSEIVWLDEIRRSLEQADPSTGATVVLGDLSDGWHGRGLAYIDANGAKALVMHHTDSGSLQQWQLSDAGVIGAADLPGAQGLGTWAGSGDFDGDAREDLAWMDAATGVVTLVLDPSGAGLQTPVDRPLPAGGVVVSGSNGSDDSAFYERFCSGDLDGNGVVNGKDKQVFRACLDGSSDPACSLADMDSSGGLNLKDLTVLKMRIQGVQCEAP